MKMSFHLFFAIYLLSANIFAQKRYEGLPKPPEGMRWVINEKMSDEFNGNSLNTDKWIVADNRTRMGLNGKYNTTMAKKSTVSVNGNGLNIRPVKFKKPEIHNYINRKQIWVNGKKKYKQEKTKGVFTHAGASINSRYKQKYGYFECKMRASKTSLSASFFLMHHPWDSRNSKNPCDNRITELDIVEAVGIKTGKEHWVNGFTNLMMTNLHSAKADTKNCGIKNWVTGNAHAPLKGKVWERMNRFGAWWVNKNLVRFYLNGKLVLSVKTPSDFNLRMGIYISSTSYSFNPPKDGHDGLNSTNLKHRTAKYDWVRSYALVPMTKSNKVQEYVKFDSPPKKIQPSKKLDLKLNYNAKQNREIMVSFWRNNKWIAGVKRLVKKGKRSIALSIPFQKSLASGEGYSLRTHIRPVGSNWKKAIYGDKAWGISVGRSQYRSTKRSIRKPFNPLIKNGIYTLQSITNRQVMHANSKSKYDVKMTDLKNTADQKWEFKHIGNNVYTIRNAKTKGWISISKSNCRNGKLLSTVKSKVAGKYQKWIAVDKGKGLFSFKALGCKSYSLDRKDFGKKNTAIQLYTYYKKNNNQKWRLK